MAVFYLYVISCRFKEKCDKVDKCTDAEKTCGEEVKNTHTCLTFIEFVSTEVTEEEAKKKCYPLTSLSAHNNGVVNNLRLRRSLINGLLINNGRLLIYRGLLIYGRLLVYGLLGLRLRLGSCLRSRFCFFYLTTAKGTNYRNVCNCAAAIFTNLC